jgi:hypothetical protein
MILVSVLAASGCSGGDGAIDDEPPRKAVTTRT